MSQMKEMFEKPVMDLILFDSEDIIITSGCPSDDECDFVCTNHCRTYSCSDVCYSDQL